MNNISMKIFSFFLLLAMIGCTKEDDTLQEINTFSVIVTHKVEIPYVVTSKDEIVFDITISPNSENRINEAILSLDGKDLSTASVSSSGDIDLKYTHKLSANDTGKSLIFRLTVNDEENHTLDKDFTVYVESAPANILASFPSDAPSEIMDDESVDFNIMIVSENDLKYIKTLLNGGELTSLTKDIFNNPKEDIYKFSYQPTIADADKTLEFTIEIMDVMGNIQRQPYSLFIERSQEADFNAYYDVNIGAQRSPAAGPFFNASTGEVYVTEGSPAQSENIDLTAYYGSGAFHLTSPTFNNIANYIYTEALFGNDAMVKWPVRKRTFIKRIELSRVDFDLIHSSVQIEELYTESSIPESDTSLGLPDKGVIVFKTASELYGVLYVKSKSANANTGYMTVDVKVQK